jgi:two-component system response regulator RegA
MVLAGWGGGHTMPTVLVVDDSPLIRRTLVTRFTSDGFDVREAGSVHAVRSMDCDGISCAVIDLQLGDGDGTDLAAVLHTRRPSLPIAFFTGGGVPSLVESARCRGPVFLKPDVTALLAWVRRMLRPSQPPAK